MKLLDQLQAKRDELRLHVQERISSYRLRLRLWLDSTVPIPPRPIHIGSAHNFIIAPVLTFTWRQHFRLLLRTFLHEVAGV